MKNEQFVGPPPNGPQSIGRSLGQAAWEFLQIRGQSDLDMACSHNQEELYCSGHARAADWRPFGVAARVWEEVEVELSRERRRLLSCVGAWRILSAAVCLSVGLPSGCPICAAKTGQNSPNAALFQGRRRRSFEGGKGETVGQH